MSDQDFFFDEDEKPAEKSAKQAAKDSSSKSAPARKAKGTGAQASGMGIELTWTVTALIGVVTLLLGVIIGYALPKNTVDNSALAPTGQQDVSAPQLTPEQLESGQLPEGHPDIGGVTGGSTTPTGSTAATGN